MSGVGLMEPETQRVVAAAMTGLIQFVKSDFPDAMSITEIVETWGRDSGLNDEQIAAIVLLDGMSNDRMK